MRIEYMKAVIEAELAMEHLTPKEQIEYLMSLIEDLNEQYPEYKLYLMRMDMKDESALDW